MLCSGAEHWEITTSRMLTRLCFVPRNDGFDFLLSHCEPCVAWRGNLLTVDSAVQCCAVVLYFGRLPRHGCSQGYALFLVIVKDVIFDVNGNFIKEAKE